MNCKAFNKNMVFAADFRRGFFWIARRRRSVFSIVFGFGGPVPMNGPHFWMIEMGYICEATSVKGFVQQIAVVYLTKGYRWFVQGDIPVGKSVVDIDAKLLNKHGIDISETTRWRRKKLGLANVQYLRLGRRFVLLATNGKKQTEPWRLVEETPIRVCNYSISRRPEGRTREGIARPRLRSHVQIDWEHYKELKAMFDGLSCRRSAEELTQLFYELPFEPYAPVRRQVAGLRALVNRNRRSRGLALVSKESFPMKSYSVPVYRPNTVVELWSPLGKWWYEIRRPSCAFPDLVIESNHSKL